MSKEKNLNEVLTKIFTSNKFILSLMQDMNEYDSDTIDYRLSLVLMYFMVSKDTDYDQTFIEILNKYSDMKDNNTHDISEINGLFMTHSFNGYKKPLIEKYGFDYASKMSEEEKKELNLGRFYVNSLESYFTKSTYAIKDEKNASNTYITSPGTKTIYYASRNAPERLYEGPFNQKLFAEEPIVVGESKATYYYRLVMKKAKEKYTDSQTLHEISVITKKIVRKFCKENPRFALIPIESIKDKFVAISGIELENSKLTLEEHISSQRFSDVFQFFTSSQRDYSEPCNLEDLAISSNDIPTNGLSFVELKDSFEMKQIYAKSKGANIGDVIDYNDCSIVREATIQELMGVIENINNEQELERVKSLFDSLQDKYKVQMERYALIVQTTNIKELEEIKQDLDFMKNYLEEKTYQSKEGILTPSMNFLLEELKTKGQFETFLTQDNIILEDAMQYTSDLHGMNHTRRVNFFANKLMNEKEYKFSDRDRQIMYEIVKNHDIGRINDEEDNKHGVRGVKLIEESPERLKGYSEDEVALIKFVISEHSQDTNHNKQSLIDLESDKRAEYTKFLSVFKDADKLDRVRLDPKGHFEEIGLDPKRLSTPLKYKYEGIAYQSYNKLLPMLEIEKELFYIEEYMRVNKQLSLCSEFNSRLTRRKELINTKREKLLARIIKRGIGQTNTRDLLNVHNMFSEINNESKEGIENERSI